MNYETSKENGYNAYIWANPNIWRKKEGVSERFNIQQCGEYFPPMSAIFGTHTTKALQADGNSEHVTHR